MTKTKNLSEIRTTLQKFQDGYTARDVARLDDFMQLFVSFQKLVVRQVNMTSPS